ncbi:MAG: hypothetical protein GY821_11000, partial [Gammaproteobacteria bacterium]|nr:hypothetical protein [Gammaproteobacteria bacterium]
MIDHLNSSVNLAEDGFEDEEVPAFASTSDEEEIENNPSQNAPKMDAEAIKELMKELREDISAQNQLNSDALVAQMNAQSKQLSEKFTAALTEVQGNVEQVRRETIGNERLGDWGEEDELQQNPITAAENQSSRQEDDFNSSRQDHRKATRDSRKETNVKEPRESSKGREHKRSQDVRHNDNGSNNAQGERNFYNQNYRPPSNNAQQQPNMQQSPPLNLSQPPNMQQQPKIQQQAQSTQSRSGGQGPQYQDRSQFFRPSSKPGQNS